MDRPGLLYHNFLGLFTDSTTGATTTVFPHSLVPPSVATTAATSGGLYMRQEMKSDFPGTQVQKQAAPEVKKAIAKPPKKRKGTRLHTLPTSSPFSPTKQRRP